MENQVGTDQKLPVYQLAFRVLENNMQAVVRESLYQSSLERFSNNTSMVKYTPGCNSGRNVIRKTNYSLIDFKAHSTGGKHMSAITNLTMDMEFIDPHE